MNLENALAQLDPEVDGHWTADGLPRLDALREHLPEGINITRKHVTDIAPDFVRTTACPFEPDPDYDPSVWYEDAEDGDEEEEVEDDAEEEVEDVEADEPEPEPAVDSGEQVLAMAIPEVLADYNLTVLAKDAIGERIKNALAAKGEIERELEQLNAKNDILKRAEVGHVRSDPSLVPAAPVKAYLERQRQSRAERVARARRFLDAGTSAKDVAAELNMRSPIDSAMAPNRKRHTRRPSRSPIAG